MVRRSLLAVLVVPSLMASPVTIRERAVLAPGGEINGTSLHFCEAWGYDVRAVFDQALS